MLTMAGALTSRKIERNTRTPGCGPQGNDYDGQLAPAACSWSQVNYGCKNNPHQMGGNPGNFVLRSGARVTQ